MFHFKIYSILHNTKKGWKPNLSFKEGISGPQKGIDSLQKWPSDYTAYEDLFLPLVSCLEEIVHSSAEWNRDTRSEAHSFLLAVFLHCDFSHYAKKFSLYKGS